MEKEDPYYRLGALILKMGDPNLEKAIFKLLKQYAHPDKGNYGDEIFKAIAQLEGDLRGTR
jgi:hypothetical protein